MPARSTKKTARAPKHSVPVSLQLALRSLEAGDTDAGHLLATLAKADARAVRLLTDPMRRLEHEGPMQELEALAHDLGSEEAADKIAAVIPEAATHDPHSWLADHASPWQRAGFLLGLSLGFRMGSRLHEKDATR